jgi:glycogen debranching enzyme
LTTEVLEKIESSVEALKKHFYEDGCINGIAEIFDGKNPTHGKGTINQAWSISSLIQIIQNS